MLRIKLLGKLTPKPTVSKTATVVPADATVVTPPAAPAFPRVYVLPLSPSAGNLNLPGVWEDLGPDPLQEMGEEPYHKIICVEALTGYLKGQIYHAAASRLSEEPWTVELLHERLDPTRKHDVRRRRSGASANRARPNN